MSTLGGLDQGVSVVTTTWNEKENIEELILKVRQVLKDFQHEIIVVDDSSSDGTFEAAKPFADVVVSKKRKANQKGCYME